MRLFNPCFSILPIRMKTVVNNFLKLKCFICKAFIPLISVRMFFSLQVIETLNQIGLNSKETAGLT